MAQSTPLYLITLELDKSPVAISKYLRLVTSYRKAAWRNSQPGRLTFHQEAGPSLQPQGKGPQDHVTTRDARRKGMNGHTETAREKPRPDLPGFVLTTHHRRNEPESSNCTHPLQEEGSQRTNHLSLRKPKRDSTTSQHCQTSSTNEIQTLTE